MSFRSRNRTFRKLGLILVFLAVFLTGVLFGQAGNFFQTKQSLSPANESFLILDPSQKIKVKTWYVIDGDTLKLESGERVRLLGANANKLYKDSKNLVPDEFGNKAFALCKSWVENKIVLLEFDKTGVRDRYGRILAYVWVDDKMLNIELIKRGLAKIPQEFVESDSTYKDQFIEAENYAKKHKLGLWRE